MNSRIKPQVTLFQTTFTTPLGSVQAIADDDKLYLLEFTDRSNLSAEIEKLCTDTHATLSSGFSAPLKQIQKELHRYFEGTLTQFTTPLQFIGTPFQQCIWSKLRTISYGETQSYSQLAHIAGCPRAHRAVAHANSSNQLALIVPCHRVITKNGDLGGYAGGTTRKQWLINHEKMHKQQEK